MYSLVVKCRQVLWNTRFSEEQTVLDIEKENSILVALNPD